MELTRTVNHVNTIRSEIMEEGILNMDATFIIHILNTGGGSREKRGMLEFPEGCLVKLRVKSCRRYAEVPSHWYSEREDVGKEKKTGIQKSRFVATVLQM